MIHISKFITDILHAHVFKCLYALKMAMIDSRNIWECFYIQELVKFVGDKPVYIYLFQNVRVCQIPGLFPYFLSLLYW
jgi:hypothetical protein